MRVAKTLCIALGIAASVAVAAQSAEPKGAKDHPLVGRFNGAQIETYAEKKYDSRLFVTNGQPGFAVSTRPENSRTLEGKSVTIFYLGPKDATALEIFRNYQDSMKERGFEPLYACENSGTAIQCPDFRTIYLTVFQKLLSNGNCFANARYATLHRSDAGGEALVAIMATDCNTTNPNYAGRARIAVSVVEKQAMTTGQIVVPTPEAMTQSFARDGRIALYGVYFDTGKADLKPESKPTLDQIAALLKANPALALIVTGHTDNEGDFAGNVALSKRRADAVAAALGKAYGIGAGRLTAFGAGMASPTAPNSDEAGRAKNRRVELVPR